MLIIAGNRAGTPPPLFRKTNVPLVRIDLKKEKDLNDQMLNVKWDRDND
jgi:hypothetical protein